MPDDKIEKFDEDLIRGRIYSIRGFQVMLDRDLAELYGVETKILNKAVKRNSARFPENFCFKLTPDELESLRFHFGTIENGRGRHSKYLPYVFTEQGVAMLAGILTSETAVRVSIYIMNAFVAMRKFIQSNAQVFKKFEYLDIKQAETTLKLIETDKRVDKIFSLMESGDLKPVQGIFFEGQIFDAFNFVSELFRGAEKSILIIDNYIDDSVLIAQYFPVEVKVFPHSHDRFIIIDGRDVYHVGASLKDLGKKWGGFSKFGKLRPSLI